MKTESDLTIKGIISNINELSEDATVFAKKINGEFEASSEVIILELTEEEHDTSIAPITAKYCPEFEYFLEGSILKEMIEDIRTQKEYNTVDKQVKAIIHYAVFDA